jgi:hypothetical protein
MIMFPLRSFLKKVSLFLILDDPGTIYNTIQYRDAFLEPLVRKSLCQGDLSAPAALQTVRIMIYFGHEKKFGDQTLF